VIAAGGRRVQLATRVLGVSEPGYYAWRGRAPSARVVRHAWLIEQIQAVHAASRGTYGSCRVHAELTLGLGHHRRPWCGGDADTPGGDQGPARQPSAPAQTPDSNRW
jgi:hypothetical protein